MKWILILTILQSNHGGNSIEHIPGFKTVEDCKAAGDMWLAKKYGVNVKSAICVPQ